MNEWYRTKPIRCITWWIYRAFKEIIRVKKWRNINFNYKKNKGDTETITHKIKNSGDGNYSEIDDGGKEYSEEDLADRLYQANN